jgi:hypothetical protein
MKSAIEASEGYDRGPPEPFDADTGLEGDIWGDPDLPTTADGEEEENDEDDGMQSPGGQHPRMLPRPPHSDDEGNPFLTIVDSTGIHHLPFVRCRCRNADLHEEYTYLKMGLFPTSFERIQTLFTIDVLRDFRLANLECKTSAYQYYQKLRRLTCPAFPTAVLNRYRELRRLSREYRNLKLWKMHGRAHDEPDGAEVDVTAGTTSPGPRDAVVDDMNASEVDRIARGTLCSFCPACPQPGVNLPEGWQHDPQRYDGQYSSSPFGGAYTVQGTVHKSIRRRWKFQG